MHTLSLFSSRSGNLNRYGAITGHWSGMSRAVARMSTDIVYTCRGEASHLPDRIRKKAGWPSICSRGEKGCMQLHSLLRMHRRMAGLRGNLYVERAFGSCKGIDATALGRNACSL